MKSAAFLIAFSVLYFELSAQNIFPASGNAGIGTATPVAPLTIKQTLDGAGIRLQPPNGPHSGNYLEIGTNQSYPFIYSMWSNTRLDISGGYKLFLFAHDIHLEGNAIVGRLGDPGSLATSKSSRTMPFEANVWNGTQGVITYAGLQNIASTTTNSAHRLGFKVAALNTDLSDGVEVLSVCSNNTVGINTTDTKGYKLAVNGSAIFTKAVVETYNTWPDYVFKKSYKLPTLPEIERYILQHHHLPEIPSADEVKKSGIDLGSNQALLLKKVEELTLYLIEQNKRNDQQQKEIDFLKKQLQSR